MIFLFIYVRTIDCKTLTSDRRKMIFIPLESSHQGESNGSKIIFLGPILMEIAMFKVIIVFTDMFLYKMKI